MRSGRAGPLLSAPSERRQRQAKGASRPFGNPAAFALNAGFARKPREGTAELLAALRLELPRQTCVGVA